MSNCCFNEIRAKAEILQKFMEDGNFDFSKLIPMPFSLKLKFCSENSDDSDTEDAQNWCMSNWCTKGNASDTVYFGDDIVSFETVWSAPYRVYEKICEMYPDEKITFFTESAEGTIAELENTAGTCKLVSYAETVWDGTEKEHIVRMLHPVKTQTVRDAAEWLWEKIDAASSEDEVALVCKECEEKFGVLVEKSEN